MIVVFTGGGFEPGEIAPYIWRAIRSDEALPENPASRTSLRRRVKAAQRPSTPRSPSTVPRFARSVSGKLYLLDSNRIDLRAISLVFGNNTEAGIHLKIGNEDWNFPAGLDGRYRISPDGPFHLPMAAMGDWRSDREFLLDVNLIANINHFFLSVRFEGDRVDLTINEATGEIRNLQVTGSVQAVP